MSSLRLLTHDLFRQLKVFDHFSFKSKSDVAKKVNCVNFLEIHRQKSKYTNTFSNPKNVRSERPKNMKKGRTRGGKEFDRPNFNSDEVWDDDEADEKMEKMSFYDIDDEPPRLTQSDRWHLKMNIIKKKYFKDDPEVSILSWEAKEQIRFLHYDAPDIWTVESLAESFPVSEAGVKKILQSTYKPKSFIDIQYHNQRVRNRWLALKGALDSGDENTFSEFRYLLEPNKLLVLLNANGNLDLPMPRGLHSKQKNLLVETQKRKTGLFKSIVEDYQLAMSAKLVKSEEEKLPNTDCQQSDEEILSEIKFLGTENKNMDFSKKSNMCKTNENVPEEIIQNKTPKLSRRQRRVESQGESSAVTIDLTNVPSFESYQTSKISHKVYGMQSESESNKDDTFTYKMKRETSETAKTNQFDIVKTKRKHLNVTNKNSRKDFKNSFRFANLY